ncbi:MAG: hypothetical protein J7K88_13505, partial [Candidatus Fermentibacteraceae bacterium]|nr:hypothetical protein [Candidatus Fermentibacteraceae bacterium]
MGLESLKNLPAVHEIISDIETRLPGLTPSETKKAARDGILWARQCVMDGGELPPTDSIVDKCVLLGEAMKKPAMEQVINATGVVLHTAIGRASLPPAAVEAVSRVARGYSVLQWNRETGKRGNRDTHIE